MEDMGRGRGLVVERRVVWEGGGARRGRGVSYGKGAGPRGGEACRLVSEAITCEPGFLSESKAEGPSVERWDWSKQR